MEKLLSASAVSETTFRNRKTGLSSNADSTKAGAALKIVNTTNNYLYHINLNSHRVDTKTI